MFKYLIILLAFITPVQALLIQEVYVNPIGTESGGEFLILYNPSNESVDIGNYLISTENSGKEATIPNGTVLLANETYMIADLNWKVSKDNQSWPDADYEEPISLTNSDGGVAIVFNDTILDAVGWGDPSEIREGLFEGSPFIGLEEGFSIRRVNDTDNNVDDFVLVKPFEDELEEIVITSYTFITYISLPKEMNSDIDSTDFELKNLEKINATTTKYVFELSIPSLFCQ